MQTYGRDYRSVTSDDVRWCRNALDLNQRSDAQLRRLHEAHSGIQMFASAVICKAIEAEQVERAERQAKSEFNL